ncbi:MAG: nucleotidyltransferase family protein [Oscillospiraceae bacterium]|nr:nucleotidyltransferase family protein [Oscillospiraceae bacterium]
MSESENKRIGAVITAAGMSSRMGRFKPLLPFGNGTVISRCVSNMKCAGAQTIVVVTGNNADEIRAHLKESGCIFAHNPDFAESQMFDSLCIGLAEIEGKCDRVLITPVDVPAVSERTVTALAQSEADIARPVYNGKTGHPLAINAALIPKILSYGGEGGLRGALQSLGTPITDIETDDEGIGIDADTPEDYDRILKLEGSRK